MIVRDPLRKTSACRWHNAASFFDPNSLDLLRFIVCRFVLDSEKQWSGPPSAGDQACDFGETLVAGALILVPIGLNNHEVNPIARLTDKSFSGADERSASGPWITSFLEGSTELAKSFPNADAERSECLLLDS